MVVHLRPQRVVSRRLAIEPDLDHLAVDRLELSRYRGFAAVKRVPANPDLLHRKHDVEKRTLRFNGRDDAAVGRRRRFHLAARWTPSSKHDRSFTARAEQSLDPAKRTL